MLADLRGRPPGLSAAKAEKAREEYDMPFSGTESVDVSGTLSGFKQRRHQVPCPLHRPVVVVRLNDYYELLGHQEINSRRR